jgi:hypothetical protein
VDGFHSGSETKLTLTECGGHAEDKDGMVVGLLPSEVPWSWNDEGHTTLTIHCAVKPGSAPPARGAKFFVKDMLLERGGAFYPVGGDPDHQHSGTFTMAKVPGNATAAAFLDAWVSGSTLAVETRAS